MPARCALKWICAWALALSTATVAVGYIHFPPMTLKKMCRISHHIRLLQVEKSNKEMGVILFQIAETLKGERSQISSFKHVIRADTEGVKPIQDWMSEGKTAVMFTQEGGGRGLGYVFIDHFCYSVDYNTLGKYWLALRGEPALGACFHGQVDVLRKAVQDTLAGKVVEVPTKKLDKNEDKEKRDKLINDHLNKYRR
ncbi:MAG: hypothetical protein L0Y70_06130 [Gemmataceae bacterium]|nr:hypothetical protein [Gemmataceae bacterium]